MSFLSIATPFVALGIPVFPLTPKTKIPPSGFHFLEEATIDPGKVASWNDENPDYNVALLANGEFCFLEFDVAKGMSAAAAEMGHEIPLTRTQVTSAAAVSLSTPCASPSSHPLAMGTLKLPSRAWRPHSASVNGRSACVRSSSRV